MIKKIVLLLFFVLGFESNAQVGINTTAPKAQLEIKSTNEATPANTDGLLIPKINAFPVTNPTVDQQGMLVYLTTTVGANTPGFYYWNNPTTAWLPVKGTDGGTLDQAYDFGGAGNGRTITADNGAVTINGADGLVVLKTSLGGALAPSGSGTRMVWNPRKSAFRAGQAFATEWDDVNIGNGSAAFGINTISSANQTMAFGFNTIANAHLSTAFGDGTTASGIMSTAFGDGTTASGSTDTAFGSNTIASGSSSTAFGSNTIASGATSTAFGQTTTASGNLSTAFGQNTIASGNRSTAFGFANSALGTQSTVFGLFNTSASLAETVIGIGATTYTPSTNGDTKFTTANATDRLFVIGNAIDLNNSNFVDASERSDAMVVLKNGLTRLPSTTNTMIDAADGKAIATKEWVQTNAIDKAWSITGNSGTDAATNFIGTTDDTDLILKRNNVVAGRIGGSINSFGTNSLANNSTGVANNAFGNFSLFSNTSGSSNGAFGNFSLTSNTTGTQNNAFGNSSLVSNTSGSQNNAFGINSLGANTIGNQNSAFGAFSLSSNSSGNLNSAFGYQSMNANTIGINNSAFGALSLVANTIGQFNSAFGTSSLKANTIGESNSAFGESSLFSNTLGNSNSSFGLASLFSNVDGSRNSAFGVSCLSTNSSGNNNSAFGHFSLFNNSTGQSNTAIGRNTLFTNTIGSNNSAFGFLADVATNNLTNATAIGANAQVGTSNSMVLGSINGVNGATATVNVGVGTTTPLERLHVAGKAFLTNGFSSDNAALLYRNDTDYMFLGPQSGSSADGGAMALYGSTNVTGGNAGGIDFNIPGSQVRMNHTNGSYIFRANSTSGYTATFELNDVGLQIGHNSASRDVVFNTASTERMRLTATGRLGIGTPTPGGQLELSLNEGRKPTSNTWTIPSDARLKNVDGIYQKGLAEILQLKPIRYHYKNTDKKSFESKVLEKEAYGFLAQEVQQIFPEAVGTDADGYLNFDLHPILVAYTNAFKELNLKNQAVENNNRELELKLKSQEQIINNLIERLEKLEAKN